ncbi:MAG: hypothetical protein IPP94_13910 [Ignavibacteria bacterium]|nr:hypothetical protein [Ignavibacteria bacterium]
MEHRYQQLLETTGRLGTRAGRNLVAFSGGVDSALVAHVVREVYPSAIACIGVSDSPPRGSTAGGGGTPASQIGIPLRFVPTNEGAHPEYVANQGMSCYFCKTSLYGSMSALVDALAAEVGPTVLFNGSNADDLQDPTRVGLKAASEFRVASPLSELTKADVRDLARHAGLPNWDTAASPCLRFRVSTGRSRDTREPRARIEERSAACASTSRCRVPPIFACVTWKETWPWWRRPIPSSRRLISPRAKSICCRSASRASAHGTSFPAASPDIAPADD